MTSCPFGHPFSCCIMVAPTILLPSPWRIMNSGSDTYLGLILQIGSTIYVILVSLPRSKLLFPSFLALIAGTIKYAERNRTFYLACFDHFGDNWCWAQPSWSFVGSFPNQFLYRIFFSRDETVAVFGIFKSLLVGPRMSSQQKAFVLSKISRSNSNEVLQSIEINLSILYEVLHTNFPVVDSKIGYVCRIINFGCILGALLSFSILKKYWKLRHPGFDICLAYALLIGALALNLISIIYLMMFSDWILFARYKMIEGNKLINRPTCRWSNSVPLLNFITHHLKDYPVWFNNLVDFLCIRSLFDVIRRIRCVSSKNFRADQEWHFIFTQLKRQNIPTAGNAQEMGEEIHPNSYDGILQGNSNLYWSIKNFEYMESLVIWHTATEICYLEEDPDNRPSSASTSTASASTSTARGIDHRKICKLLSDYLLYIAVTEPTMVVTMSKDLQTNFQRVSLEAQKYCLDRNISIQMDFSRGIHSYMVGPHQQNLQRNRHILFAATELAKELKQQQGDYPWELMSKVWVEFVCYAAFNCKPIIHARQVSRGGQLLTLVWVLLNILRVIAPNEWRA